jgi:hypothetical protein
LLATPTADHADQIRSAELQVVFLAKSVELLQLNARQESSPVAFGDRGGYPS